MRSSLRHWKAEVPLESRSAIGKRGRDHRCLLWKTRPKIDLWEKRSNSLKLRTKKKKTHSKRFIFGKSGSFLAVLNVILLYAYYSVRRQRFQVENREMWKFIRDLVNFAMILS